MHEVSVPGLRRVGQLKNDQQNSQIVNVARYIYRIICNIENNNFILFDLLYHNNE